MVVTLALLVAGLVYVATFVLGLGLHFNWWRVAPARALHHALFAAIWVSLGATAALAWWSGSSFWFGPLLVLAWMLPLPRFRAGGMAHRLLASGGLLTLLLVGLALQF
ncbi:MAG: hypothetical protein MUD01_08280 [Chloroflexaceae bacterium]|jgi:hypothetical protein|nr:hypothetical protein [Chloroflexaceae bacterium]